jgi:hypothetical protein
LPKRLRASLRNDAADDRLPKLYCACQRFLVDKPKRLWYYSTVKIPDEARAWLQAIGRKGGSVKSKAKTAAVRKNGKLGGRPRKDAKR